jgi:hypothetical protein
MAHHMGEAGRVPLVQKIAIWAFVLVALAVVGIYVAKAISDDESKPQPAPVASAPPRTLVKAGETPRLLHGKQTLVIAPGSTGCIRPAPGDTQLSATVHNTVRTKDKVKIFKECDFGDGIEDNSPSGKFNNIATYSFRAVNNSPEPVVVDTWSW